MVQDQNVIVLDIDRTLAQEKQPGQSYADVAPIYSVLNKLREYHANGYYIILYTSRDMSTYAGNVGRILANSAPLLFDWLNRYEVPYDEIHFGKPWCGRKGFYVDDKAIRPSEFARLTESEIYSLLREERDLFKQLEGDKSA